MIEAVKIWNEPNNKSHWDLELDPGWARFAERPTTDLEGVMSWIKPALPVSRYYPDGFTNEFALMGSRYKPPVGATNRILSLTNGLVLLDGGDLSQSFTNAVVLGPGNKLTNASPNSLALTFNPASGLFRGSFLPPATITDGLSQTLCVGERSVNLSLGRGMATWVGTVPGSTLDTM